METCCTIVAYGVILYVFLMIIIAINDASRNRRNRIEDIKSTIDNHLSHVWNLAETINNTIQHFFSETAYHESPDYDTIYVGLKNTISEMESTIAQARNKNCDLPNRESQQYKISETESACIPKARKLAESFFQFGCRVRALEPCYMMDPDSYGKIHHGYWDAVCAMTREDAVSYISWCSNVLDSTRFDEIFSIDLEQVMRCIWFFATEKTFSASDFNAATNVFYRIYRKSHVDVEIAGLYAKRKMGGEETLHETIRNLLKVQGDFQVLTLLASGLMWMNAYQSEHMVLQHMLAHGIQMSPKAQERLHSLTNGGGKAPSGFDVQSSGDKLYFDVSALAWRDEEYIGLFENLAFQDRTLSYSLAIRDEHKDLFIPQGIALPRTDSVFQKLKAVFSEEYGPTASIQSVKCIALSGSGEEMIDGLLATSSECRQLGVLIHIARIGKKLIIKFYTLFIPVGNDLTAQKQQALSICKKLSPTVTMWEGSLKDTMLMAVEQLLNTNAQWTSDPYHADAAGDVNGSPVF